ncbi:MAG: dihydrofolate synthase/folylpolyglutamate synthase [Parasphingorhabdus sp.]|jgi:dihydrofolate synthase/folylpolyglutamate synthase
MTQSELSRWLDHIEKVHYRSIDLSLDRVRRVLHCLRLKLPYCVVAVAGTNGKGSTVAFLESIYQAAGYRIAAFTSPHLVRYNERVRIDGAPVDDELLVNAFEKVESARGSIPLTYFEFGTLAALVVFEQSGIDIAILEVGMGGRLDAVNIIDSDVAIITEIGLDHQAWLGNTVEKIGREKSGIMRSSGKVVSSGIRPPNILASRASEIRADLYQLGVDYGFEVMAQSWHWKYLRSGEENNSDIANLPALSGAHQCNNASGVIACIKLLENRLPVSLESIKQGLKQVNLPGRIQVVKRQPELILDVSHNPDGVQVLAAHLAENPVPGCTRAVFSMLEDKDIAAVAALLSPHISHWNIAELDNVRAAGTAMLERAIRYSSHADITVCSNISSALELAELQSDGLDRVVVFGSFYAAGDIIRYLHHTPYPVPA